MSDVSNISSCAHTGLRFITQLSSSSSGIFSAICLVQRAQCAFPGYANRGRRFFFWRILLAADLSLMTPILIRGVLFVIGSESCSRILLFY